jgi:5-methylcytosine-specific restriction enzyme B
VFYGPPGTGKTFVAEGIARFLIAGGDGFYTTIQFHPSYSYEDFLEGRRPEPDDEGRIAYPVVPGRFLRFCEEARKRTGKCVLIIDEFNRANVSQVLGELLYLLEYRGESLTLPTSNESFGVPKNVVILGTMNTADRSIAIVDLALRRRFVFIPLRPDYDLLRSYHVKSTGLNVESLIKALDRVNKAINDPNMSIGPSYFLTPNLKPELDSIWRTEIEPYLEEVFVDSPDQVDAFRWDRMKGEITF